MSPTDFAFAPSLRRIRAIARVRALRLLRTRRAILAATLALLPWLALGDAPLAARLSALADFTLVGLTVLAAGAIAEDLDGGQLAIACTHGASPHDLLLGESAASLGFTLTLVALQLPLALGHDGVRQLALVLLCLAWLSLLLAAWLALMLFLATLLRGVGNAVATIPLLTVLPLLASAAFVDRLPAAIAPLIRVAVRLVPSPRLTAEIFGAILTGTPQPRLAVAVLMVSPPLFFVAALARLSRIEPAGRVAA